jgi:RNase P/RNase MRP subunit POP5
MTVEGDVSSSKQPSKVNDKKAESSGSGIISVKRVKVTKCFSFSASVIYK